MAEDPGMEHPDRGIGGDINLQTVPVEVEAELEQQEVTPAINRVEMEEMEFSLASPGWPLGTAVVEPVDRGTGPAAPVEWAVEETEEVKSPRLQGRME